MTNLTPIADTGEKHSVSLVYESVVIVMVNNRPRTHHLDMSFYSAFSSVHVSCGLSCDTI